MIDMDKYRVQQEQNGYIVLKDEDGILESSPDDGHRGGEAEKEKLKLIVKKLNENFGILFEEAGRVMNTIKEAFLSNADEFLGFMSKTETDAGFGNVQVV